MHRVQDIIDAIEHMTTSQLLEHVVTHPFHLTDSYYIQIREAILARYELLKKQAEEVALPYGFHGWPWP